MVGFIGFSLSSEKGLDFVVRFASVLLFFLFLWYALGINYKSEEGRKKYNKITFLLFLLIILISILQIAGLILFFPSIELSLKGESLLALIISLIIFSVTFLILDKVGKNSLKKNHK